MTNSELYDGLEDVVYSWSLRGAPWDNLVGDLYDFVTETYGPPF